MEKQTINPWTWQEPLGFSQGVLVAEPRRTLYAAGQGPVDATGSLTDDAVREQLRQFVHGFADFARSAATRELHPLREGER